MSLLREKAQALDEGDLRVAVVMAAAIDHMVRLGRIDARSPAADARLDLGDGGPYTREETAAILGEVLPGFRDPTPRANDREDRA